MKNKAKIKISKYTDKVAFRYFLSYTKKLPTKQYPTPETKVEQVKKIRFRTLFVSALYGALGVILLYLPQSFFPDQFQLKNYVLPFIDFEFKASPAALIYGFFLVVVEIWLLTMTDIRAVGRIAAVYGFPPEGEPEEDIEELVYISLGKDNDKFKELGLNPLQQTSKAGVFLMISIFRLKAILSKFIFQFVLKRTLGRLAFRTIIDMAGIPIYAFWNAYASAAVIRKASMRLRAHELMQDTGKWFYSRFQESKEFNDLLYDTFEYIAVVKKSFHPTDYLFAKYFLNLFRIPPEKEHQMSPDFLEKTASAIPEIRTAIGKLLIIGFLMDGKLGRLEIVALKLLQKKKIVLYDIPTIKQWAKEYEQGKCFDKLLQEK